MAETLTKPSTSSPDASGDGDKSRGRFSAAQENLQGLEKVFIPYEGFLGTSATKEQLRRSLTEPVQTALEEPAGETSFLDALLGTSMLEPPIERHAAIMSDPRFSHPANAPTSSRIVNRMHQTYGNSHVQQVTDYIQAMRDKLSPDSLVQLAAASVQGARQSEHYAGLQRSDAQPVQTKLEQLAAERTGTYNKATVFRSEKEEKDFERIVGGIEKGKAPEKIKLPKELVEGLTKSWKESIGRLLREKGGALVRCRDGSYEWRQFPPGDPGGIMPAYQLGKGEKVVAIGHTHPYRETQDVSFSASDLTRLVRGGLPVMLAISGKTVFMAARSAEFNEMVERLDEVGQSDLIKEMQAYYERRLNSYRRRETRELRRSFGYISPSKGDFLPSHPRFPMIMHLAAYATCKKYNLLYYMGTEEGLQPAPYEPRQLMSIEQRLKRQRAPAAGAAP